MEKDEWMVQTLIPKNPDIRKKSNVQAVTYFNATRKTKLVLAVMGCWAIWMPPYNLGRLAALTRSSGYSTKCFDFNVQSYHDFREMYPGSDLEDAWGTGNWWWWKERYFDKIHERNIPLLEKYVDEILAEDPDIVGLSLYFTNRIPSEWVANEIKKRRPNVMIIFGGPECHSTDYVPPDSVDHWFTGESEQLLLDFLEKYETGEKITERHLGSLYSATRIDIDSLPFPDYSDFDFSKYLGHLSINTEISRGCIAKCSFCSETYYWKYRDREAHSILDEIEHQVKVNDIKAVSFVDSLVNGNLKSLKGFAEGLLERKLNIRWWGYARCDGRMDGAYFDLLRASGCDGFSYGVESGSQKVLDLMQKKVKVSDINENLYHSGRVGMTANANWIIGAPGEDIEALAHSMNLIWNHRNNIHSISPGNGLGDTLGTDYDNREKYNINPRNQPFLDHWYSLDWTNTQLNRYIRMKLFVILLKIAKDHGVIVNLNGDKGITSHYDLKFDDDNYIVDNIEYENFDYHLLKTGYGVFADTVVNEVFSLFRILWRIKGGFEITLNFEQEIDVEAFGGLLTHTPHTYNATHYFKIDKEGNFQSNNTYEFFYESKHWDRIENKSFKYEGNVSGYWGEVKIAPVKRHIWIENNIN